MSLVRSTEPYRPRGVKVPPRKIIEIREAAMSVRQVLEIGYGRFNPERLMDVLSLCGLTVDVVEDEYIPDEHIEAQYIPGLIAIRIPERTYNKLHQGDPRALFTLAHELGHFRLQHQFTFHRDEGQPHKAYEDSEWQADWFAGEFLMPLETILLHRLFEPEDVAEFFDVSYAAATIRLTKLRDRGEIPQ